MTETLLYFESGTVINRRPAAGLDKEIAQFREQSLSGPGGCAVAPDNLSGFAGNDGARSRERIENRGMGLDLQSMHVEIARRKRYATANFMGDFEAGLLTIGRAQG